MKKEEIYVELNDKNRDKVFKILDMFGEELNFTDNLCRHTLRYESGESINDYPNMIFYNGYWYLCKGLRALKKTKVKPRELRNMLAQEHLKKGDVVVVDNGWGRWVLELTVNNMDRFEHHRRYNLGQNMLVANSGRLDWVTDGNFLRYATEEECKLLQPVVFEPIDKFSELKQAHKNGAVIQYKIGGEWEDCLENKPNWIEENEYRIKPGEPKAPRVGDVCKFWDDDPNYYLTGRYHSFERCEEGYCHALRVCRDRYRFFKNAEPITKEEAIKLLF